MLPLQIPVINKSSFPLPAHQTDWSAGVDLRANCEAPIAIQPFERMLVPTGLFMAIPHGFEGQIRPRSGLALKHGITVLNSPGTIDSDYRGELKVLLINLSNNLFTIEPGERIAQLIVSQYAPIQWQETTELSATDRGHGGYGHTGK